MLERNNSDNSDVQYSNTLEIASLEKEFFILGATLWTRSIAQLSCRHNLLGAFHSPTGSHI
jgi:hypothetical protein